MVIVSVNDTCSGINTELLPKLFTAFIYKSFNGVGLGLYISKKIVEIPGGRILVVNNSNLKGSDFSFNMPMNQKLTA